jgi:hypothetical protein
LRLSRAGRVEYQWQLVDIASIVQKIIDALHDSITAKKAEVVINELAPVEGDPLALEQIFANLISNAVQYLDPARSGKIEVGCLDSPPSGQPAGFHVYYVRDNGLGIAESYHQRVFAIFSMQMSLKAKEWVWPSFAAWSSDMAARSGSSRPREPAPPFLSPCEPVSLKQTDHHSWHGRPRPTPD